MKVSGLTIEELCAVSSPPENTPGDSPFFWDWKRFDFSEHFFKRKRQKLINYLQRFTKSPIVMMPDHMQMDVYIKHLDKIQQIQRQLTHI